MSKTTWKNKKRKKYHTRIEKNKNIYYKNNKAVYINKNNNTKFILIILVISVFFNAIFLLRINSLDVSIDTIKDENNKYKEEYTNYLFLGDSITEIYDLDKYYHNLPVINSGISGNTTEDILDDMKARVYDYNPSKVFLLIGTNDLIHDKNVDEIVSNIKKILTEISSNNKLTEIYVESIYPVNDNMDEEMVAERTNKDIIEINEKIKKYCEDNNCNYINLYDKLTDDDGNFCEEYTYDGLHPNEKGYQIITKELKKYLD